MAILLKRSVTEHDLKEYVAKVNEFIDSVEGQMDINNVFDRHREFIDYAINLSKELKK